MRTINELIFLIRDFFYFISGKDYFRQAQKLGAYFNEDSRCYYNDLTGKAIWNGNYIDGVPAIYLVTTGNHLIIPVMVILYGIGSIDRYFLENNKAYLDNIRRTSLWLIRNLSPEGYYKNGIIQRDSEFEYYSDNSAMTQGLALSFSVRAIRYDLVSKDTSKQLRRLIDSVTTNMLLPLDEQGTAFYQGDDLFLLEFCRKDHNIVLNGWIFAIFGLLDYVNFVNNESIKKLFSATLATLERVLPNYRLENGWSYYDNMGRISSPYYHELHIALVEALHRITKRSVFEEHRFIFIKANTNYNKIRYLMSKIRDKIRDNELYVTQK
jgi:hypothetical protein